MNVNSWLSKAKTYKVDRLDAELILLDAIKKDDRSFLVAHDDFGIPEDDVSNAFSNLVLRERGIPLAYVLGYKEFYGRKFQVVLDNKKVLIPRPESEAIIDLAKGLNPKTIIDVGAGSGCLAITLALEIPDVKVYALDKDSCCEDFVKNNSKCLGANNITVAISDLLSDVDIKDQVDLIVANLPYVDENWGWLNKKQLAFEPKTALYAKDGGLELIKKLIDQIVVKKATHYLILEADPCQHDEIKKYASKCGLKHIKTNGFALAFVC